MSYYTIKNDLNPFYLHYRFSFMNKDKGARYYPGTDEEKILMDAMEKYKLAPLRSEERKQIREDTSRLLIEKGFKRWDPITVRTWFRNNLNNAKNPIAGNENEINQFSSIEPQRSPMIQNVPMMYPFVPTQPMMAPMPQQYIPAQPQQFMQPSTFYAPTPFYTPQVVQQMAAQPRQFFQQSQQPLPNRYIPEQPRRQQQPTIPSHSMEQSFTEQEQKLHEKPLLEDQQSLQQLSKQPSQEQKQFDKQTNQQQMPNQPETSETFEEEEEEKISEQLSEIQNTIEPQITKEQSKPEQQPPLVDKQSTNFDNINPNSSDFFTTNSNFFNDYSSKTLDENSSSTRANNESQNSVTKPFSSFASSSSKSKNDDSSTNSKSKVKFKLDDKDNMYNFFNDNDYHFKNSSADNNSSPTSSNKEQQSLFNTEENSTQQASSSLFKPKSPSPTPTNFKFKSQTSSESQQGSDSEFGAISESSSNVFKSNESSASAYDDMLNSWNDDRDSSEEELPEVPVIGDDINNDDYDTIKYDTYQKIQLCNRILRSTEHKFDNENEDNRRLNFQKEIEKRFVALTVILSKKLGISRIFSFDKTATEIKFSDSPSLKRQISRTTKLYNDAELSDTSSSSSSQISKNQISRTNNNGLDFSSSSVSRDQSGKDSPAPAMKPMPSIRIPKSFSCPKCIDPELKDFYYGRYKEGSRKVDEYDFIESSIMMVFNPKFLFNQNIFEKEDENLSCEFAMTVFSNESNAHILTFRDIKVNTGFFLPVTSMTYNIYKSDYGNELNIYVCGDKRIKEFTLFEINEENNINTNPYESSDKEEEEEEENKNEWNLSNKKMTLENTDTFYIGDDFIQTSVIKIWNNELVLGYGKYVLFWDIKQGKNANSPRRPNSTTTLRTSMNINTAKRSGISLQNVSWAKGKEPNKSKIVIDEMPQISCLQVIHQMNTENEELCSFLAVASSEYPVIYIYNEQHQNISRLISHTMGISSLCSYHKELISGSNDMSAKLWDIDKGVTRICLTYHNDNITAITCGFFKGKFIVFTGGEDNVVKAWSIDDKKSLFEIRLDGKFVPNQIVFLNDKNNDSAILKIVSYYSVDNENSDDLNLATSTFHKCQVLSYDF